MTTFFDKVKQYPQATANHIIYGLYLAISVSLLSQALGLSKDWGWWLGLVVTLIVVVGKKIHDYFVEKESIEVCTSKVLYTVWLPSIICVLRVWHYL